MDASITIRLNEKMLAKARRYAAKKRLSLEQLVEAYLITLAQHKDNVADNDISPFVKSMATGVSVPANVADKEVYQLHLQQKHA